MHDADLSEGLQHRNHVVFLHGVGAVGVEETSCIHQSEMKRVNEPQILFRISRNMDPDLNLPRMQWAEAQLCDDVGQVGVWVLSV